MFFYSVDVLEFYIGFLAKNKIPLIRSYCRTTVRLSYTMKNSRCILRCANKVVCIGRNMRDKYQQIFNRIYISYLVDDSYLLLAATNHPQIQQKKRFKAVIYWKFIQDFTRGCSR